MISTHLVKIVYCICFKKGGFLLEIRFLRCLIMLRILMNDNTSLYFNLLGATQS